MSAYRAPPAGPAMRVRFERSLSLRFTQVRLAPERVAVDAPDMLALVLGVSGLAGLGLPLAWDVMGGWALLGLVLIALTTRVHLRVRPGRATLVRTVLGVPWWVSRRGVGCVGSWLDWDLEGDDLVLLRTPEQASEGHGALLVLSSSFHGVTGEEVVEIARAAAEVLAGDERRAR